MRQAKQKNENERARRNRTKETGQRAPAKNERKKKRTYTSAMQCQQKSPCAKKKVACYDSNLGAERTSPAALSTRVKVVYRMGCTHRCI